MERLPSQLKDTLRQALKQRKAFALYRLPGCEPTCIVDGEVICGQQGTVFGIHPWNTPFDRAVLIGGAKQPSQPDAAAPLPASTDRGEYLASVSDLIAVLKQTGGKTVISRCVTSLSPAVDWIDAAEVLFDTYPKAFCHFGGSPSVGYWMGATPELLLAYDKDTRRYATMALAGTKAVGTEWDDKNRREQQMVTDFIVDTLRPYSRSMSVGEVETLHYGRIDHLCTHITGVLDSSAKLSEVFDSLSPTPAVAGLPRPTALQRISSAERHSRGCYGGYITVQTDGWVRAFVNLRCMQIRGNQYTIYSGGGITAQSTPEAEWAETVAKAAAIQQIIDSLASNGNQR